nr:hypothetical protein [Acidobacteriota bacterium]
VRGLERARDPVRSLETLERVRAGVRRYQDSAQELHKLSSDYILGTRRALPLGYFLRHPSFERAPHRAVVAWAAAAVRRGIPPDRVPELLSRAPRPRSATPRIYSPRFVGAIGAVAGSRLLRMAQRTVQDYAHDR